MLTLSTTLEAERNRYYEELNIASKGDMDISRWVHYFVGVILRAQLQAKEMISFVLSKARFWDRFETQLNPRQIKVMTRMFKAGPDGFEGGMNAGKYMKLTKCSKATATRDLTNLMEKGCLRKLQGGGRSTRYDIALASSKNQENHQPT